MALNRTYPPDFERLWKAYPTWPTGRSKKEPSFKAFQRAKRDLQFTEEDIDAILADIEERKRYCVTWQKGNKYGPEMFATYFNQHRWNEPFDRIRGAKPDSRGTSEGPTDEENNHRHVAELILRGKEIPEWGLKHVEGAQKYVEAALSRGQPE